MAKGDQRFLILTELLIPGDCTIITA